jgi:Zn-dependent protease
MEPITIIFSIIILVMSVVLHELSHGYAADLLGDPTPRLQGRLTINPLKHLELFGSFIVPILTSFAGITFGWAKPVIWNPYNVKNKRVGEIVISLAGPASNILAAIVFGLIVRIFGDSLSPAFVALSSYIVLINIVLAVFNLIPVPPLDGSKVIFAILPARFSKFREVMEANAIFFLIFALFIAWNIVSPLVPMIFRLIVGQ